MGSQLSVHITSMRYPDAKSWAALIEDLHLEIRPNTIVSLLGRSGAGKTTLLRMIAGLERRFEGVVQLNGRAVTKPGRDVQIVFQDYRLLPWKTVYGNVEFAVKNGSNRKDKSQIDRWIEIAGLDARKDAWIKNLSGGEIGRVALARAFVDQPKLLLLDEPFRGLDLGTKFGLQDQLLKALRASPTTVVMVSHSIEDAVFLSDNIHILTDSPMQIDRSFDIDVERPRSRSDLKLTSVAAEITEYLASR